MAIEVLLLLAQDRPGEGMRGLSSALGRTCEYVSSVNPTLACPSRSEMTLTSCQPVAAARPADA
jgi:hypothetical protein